MNLVQTRHVRQEEDETQRQQNETHALILRELHAQNRLRQHRRSQNTHSLARDLVEQRAQVRNAHK